MKNHRRPSALLIAAFALALSLAACGGSGGAGADGAPSQAVERALELYKAQDYAGFNGALTSTVNDFSPDTSEKDSSTLKAFSQIDYAITNERVTGDTAEVTASITAIDIKTAVGETVTYSFNMQLSGEWDTEDTDNLQRQYQEYYDAYVVDPARTKITADVRIGLRKVGGAWKIVPDSGFVNALTGFQSGEGNVGAAR